MARDPGRTRTAANPLERGALVLAAALLLALGPAGVRAQRAQEGTAAPAEEQKALLSRIDFGNAYVMGQTIKSGAVYLLNRKKSDIRSMLEVRKDYREEIREDAEVVDPETR